MKIRNTVFVQLFIPPKEYSESCSGFRLSVGIWQGYHRTDSGALLSIVGDDTPGLRNQIQEFVMMYPGTAVSVVPCAVDDGRFSSVGTMVESAFSLNAPQPLSFNMKDAAKRLGVSYSHMKDLVASGRIQRRKGRISGTELLRYLNR